MLAHAMANQVNQQMVAPANPNENLIYVRVWDFTHMKPLEFHGLRMDEDPKDFIDEVQKIVWVMGITLIESAYLASYQLKGMSQLWFKK